MFKIYLKEIAKFHNSIIPHWFNLRDFIISLAHIAADKFDKEYTYNIRYNYGKEGKKVNWLPWNCMRYILCKSYKHLHSRPNMIPKNNRTSY